MLKKPPTIFRYFLVSRQSAFDLDCFLATTNISAETLPPDSILEWQRVRVLCFHPLTINKAHIVFCLLYWLCHPGSHWLAVCVLCFGMSWTQSTTDSSSLDGEWPFLQPIRCHRAPLLWSQPLNWGWITLIKAIFALLRSSAEVSWWHLRAWNLKTLASFKQSSSCWCVLFKHHSPPFGMHPSGVLLPCHSCLSASEWERAEAWGLLSVFQVSSATTTRLISHPADWFFSSVIVYEYKNVHTQCQHKCLLSLL